MEFDNKAFDTKVNSTLDSLQKLDKALKLEGAQKGLIGIQEAGKKVNFSHIGASVAGVNTKFVEMDAKVKNSTTNAKNLDTALKFPSAIKGLSNVQSAAGKVDAGMGHVGTTIQGVSAKFLGVSTVAITALSNITTTAMAAGGQIIKSLSLDPILDGYREYETNIGSIQTILANTANKGSTLADVNKSLNELNTYSDKTIYNFSQMAKNIGTFTAAGVGLDESTMAIKGIANLAAMSGSTADQASSAMYQLSQAMASGSVKAQDWISVVNSGMGGEAFQKSLFDTAKALHTVKNVPIGQTFEDWKKKGGNFKEWMSTGAITSKVLAQSLQTFTGDMSKAQLVAKGYTSTQADAIMKTAKLASDAATQVKTFTQLLGTIKEAIGTGWADTFGLVIGNFEEAKKLWTGVNNFIGKVISNQAKARNDLLKGWKAFGGRTTLLKGLQTAFFNLQRAFNPIRLAFRQVFPRTTVKQLLMMTLAFEKFAKALRPSGKTVVNLNRVFKGFFAALSIGWTVLKEGVKLIVRIAKALVGLAGPGLLGFAAHIGDIVFALQQFLVKGGGIADFFGAIGDAVISVIPPIKDFVGLVADYLGPIFADVGSKIVDFVSNLGSFSDFIKNPIPFIKDLVDKIKSLFGIMGNTGVPDKLGAATGRVGQRVKTLSTLWDKFAAGFSKVWDTLSKIGEELKNFFVNLGSAIAGAMGKGDFNNVLDIINVGLLGAILITIRKFFKKGYLFDIGGGLFKKIGAVFQQLLGVLKALQTQIKSQAILNIAYAMGILTLSLIALSLIDSVALSKALTAMAVGFGELMGAFALVQKMDIGAKDVIKFTVLAGALLIVSGALFILAGTARLLSGLSWDELARGLVGVGAMLLGFVGFVDLLKKKLPDMYKVATVLLALGISVNILAIAVKKFAGMDPVALAQGLGAAAGSIGALVLALNYIPDDVDRKGLSVLHLSFALIVLGFAVRKFADMDVEQLAKGLGTATLGLLGIAIAMKQMPKKMEQKAKGVIIVSVALLLLAKAMEIIAKLSIAQILTAVTTMTVILSILIGAMEGAELAVPGAQALLMISGALLVLAIVLKTFASIPFADLLKGLLGMVVVIGVLAAAAGLLSASGLIAALEGLGLALLLIGGGFALMGAGAYFAAKALETFSKMGKKGAESAVEALGVISTIIPRLVAEIVQGFIDSFVLIAEQAPKIAAAAGKLLGSFIDVIIKLVPKVGKLFSKLIEEGLKVVRTYVKEYIKTGIFIILSLLDGIRQAIPQIVVIVGEIIVGFLDAMAQEIPRIIDSLTNLFIEVMKGIAKNSGRMMGELGPSLAISFIEGFVEGLNNNLHMLIDFFTELPGKILDLIKSLFGIDSPAKSFISIGTDLILGLLQGLVDTVGQVLSWFGSLPGKILNFFINAGTMLLDVGKKVLQGLWDGLQFVWNLLWIWYVTIPTKILSIFLNAIGWLLNIGKDIIQGLWDGLVFIWNQTWSFITSIPGKIKNFIPNPITFLLNVGGDIIRGLWQGLSDIWASVSTWLFNLPKKIKENFPDAIHLLEQIGMDIIQGLWNGMKSIWDGPGGLFKWIRTIPDKITKGIKEPLNSHSPSLVMMAIGEDIVVGLKMGLQKQWDTLDAWWSNANKTLIDKMAAKEGVAKALAEWTAARKNFLAHARTFMAEDHTIATFGTPADAARQDAALRALEAAYHKLNDLEKLQPVIKPTLDLSAIESGAAKMSSLMTAQALKPSLNNANVISASVNAQKAGTQVSTTPTTGQVNFHQTINAPEQLSTADIYKQTRNQITIAKEELKIP
jgi:tape measure domain-containing protein